MDNIKKSILVDKRVIRIIEILIDKKAVKSRHDFSRSINMQ